jgi:hypothetical protein
MPKQAAATPSDGRPYQVRICVVATAPAAMVTTS